MEIREIEPRDEAAVERFIGRVPDGDRTFFKEDVDDPAVVRAWTRPDGAHAVAVAGDEVVGFMAVVQMHGWSRHVGEVRVIVDPDHRGHGIGRALARHAVFTALGQGLTKMVVEVVADQSSTVGMFRSLGFEPEALLVDHVRDQAGELRDLMVLAHSVHESWGSLQASGVAEGIS